MIKDIVEVENIDLIVFLGFPISTTKLRN